MRIRSLFTAALTWAMIFSVSGPANAYDPQHCYGMVLEEISPNSTGEQPQTSNVPAPVPEPEDVCYPTFKEMIRAATGVELPPGTSPAEVTDVMLAETTDRTVLEIEWNNQPDGNPFTGSSKAWTTTNPDGCRNGRKYYRATPPSNWNDTAASAKGYARCGHNTKYIAKDFGTPSYVCDGYCELYGNGLAWEVSSWRWRAPTSGGCFATAVVSCE